MCIPTLAKGCKFGELKASNKLELIFAVRLPRSNLFAKNTQTSGMSKQPAIISDDRKLALASLRVSKIGI